MLKTTRKNAEKALKKAKLLEKTRILGGARYIRTDKKTIILTSNL